MKFTSSLGYFGVFGGVTKESAFGIVKKMKRMDQCQKSELSTEAVQSQ